MTLAIGRLTRAGYVYIGMDHFAQPGDELALAQRRAGCSAISRATRRTPATCSASACRRSASVGAAYYQNLKELESYYAALDAGRLPVLRGLELTADDLVRRAVIQALMCHFRVSIESIEIAHLIDFRKYFAAELADLRRLADDGLVELGARVDRGDAERPAAGARDLHGVRPLPARAPASAPPTRG